VDRLFEEIVAPEAGRIERAALDAKVVDDDEQALGFQTLAAHEEIAEVLKEANLIPAVRCSLCNHLVPEATAHIHQDFFIGDECCWQDRASAAK
jgi:hypothetical protein